MPHAQECTAEVLKHLIRVANFPASITFETNGTQELTPELIEAINVYKLPVHWSISPKLWHTAGEHHTKAFIPANIKALQDISPHGMLKFVCNGTDKAWDEIEQKTDVLRKMDVNFPVWFMPVGATVEGQKLVDSQVATEAVARGYHISARVHTYLWGNKIGV
jgi:organic radical activating enzyme